jgi:hypothetical protein
MSCLHHPNLTRSFDSQRLTNSQYLWSAALLTCLIQTSDTRQRSIILIPASKYPGPQTHYCFILQRPTILSKRRLCRLRSLSEESETHPLRTRARAQCWSFSSRCGSWDLPNPKVPPWMASPIFIIQTKRPDTVMSIAASRCALLLAM